MGDCFLYRRCAGAFQPPHGGASRWKEPVERGADQRTDQPRLARRSDRDADQPRLIGSTQSPPAAPDAAQITRLDLDPAQARAMFPHRTEIGPRHDRRDAAAARLRAASRRSPRTAERRRAPTPHIVAADIPRRGDTVRSGPSLFRDRRLSRLSRWSSVAALRRLLVRVLAAGLPAPDRLQLA